MSLQRQVWDIFITRCQDEGFRKQVLQDPEVTLKNAGADIPEGVAIKVYENDLETLHAVLPMQEQGVLEAWQKTNPAAARVIERAWNDPEYKRRLFSDPRSAFEEVAGTRPPEQWKLVGHENTSTTLHFVLPYSTSEKAELSDTDLEQVAGGKSDDAILDACTEATDWTADTLVAGAIACACSIGKT